MKVWSNVVKVSRCAGMNENCWILNKQVQANRNKSDDRGECCSLQNSKEQRTVKNNIWQTIKYNAIKWSRVQRSLRDHQRLLANPLRSVVRNYIQIPLLGVATLLHTQTEKCTLKDIMVSDNTKSNTKWQETQVENKRILYTNKCLVVIIGILKSQLHKFILIFW